MAGSFATGNIIGVGAGFMLTLHGINSIEEKVYALMGYENHTGLIKQGYVATAEFMGFDPRIGREAYTGMDIALSAYGLFKLTLKPDAWRLYRYIDSDYTNYFRTISKAALALKVISNGPKIKLIYDTHTGAVPQEDTK